MKLVIDLQGAQTGSRRRGIGRYALALAQATARDSREHDVWIALNNAFPETIEPLRAAFDGLLPQERIVIWDAPTPVVGINPVNQSRQATGEILREAFLQSLKPDVIHVSSLFEGAIDNAITSVGTTRRDQSTSVTLYDLIPLIRHDLYLTDPAVASWYWLKIGHLRRASIWLAISESSRQEGIQWLGLPQNKIVNISTAADACFSRVDLTETKAKDIGRRLGLTRPFVMYTGGIDHRKNIEGLIGAYAQLPRELRENHQLAIVCEANADSIDGLRHHAKNQGLHPDELIMTGFVPDGDLLALYNLCKVFCFPSLHEGFGLPALEAMQCGAPVIGSNTSSIPEVIGRPDALFNPRDEKDISARLHQVLTDPDYRSILSQHGLVQAKKFSWERSARRAWDAFEAHCDEAQERSCYPVVTIAPGKRPRLAYVSPLPPEQTGIADYSAEVLPELARHYDIDVVVHQTKVQDSWINSNCSVRDVGWFEANSRHYDRIVYHFGNSPFHSHMLNLIARHSGTVVLHDFFLSGLVEQTDLRAGGTGLWPRTLYRSHGYGAVETYCHENDASWRYPANLPVLQNAMGVIVHSEHPRRLAEEFFRKDITREWRVLPFPRRLPRPLERGAVRHALGFEEDDFLVCTFGMLGKTKLNDRLLRAWRNSELSDRPRSHLIFVGGADGCPELIQEVASFPASDRIRITGFASRELFRQYLSAADIAVQMRTLSRGETSAAVFDCMGHGLPTIVNAHGSLAELPRDCVVMLNDDVADVELTSALETLYVEEPLRKMLGERARAFVAEHHSPRNVADLYHEAIETFAARSREALVQQTVEALADVNEHTRKNVDWLSLARSMNHNLPRLKPQRQLLVDVSVLAQTDYKTGIQRVTRSILRELLLNPPEAFHVEPVYTLPELDGYRYARRFTLQFLNCHEIDLADERVEIHHEDVFLGLDLSHVGVLTQPAFYSNMRRVGVKTYFVIYDLLPVLMPSFFPTGVPDLHERWLSALSACADGIIGISHSVAEEFKAWLRASGIARSRPLSIDWFHLGSDIESSVPTRGVPEDASVVLSALQSRPTFLMVGTVEPRKGHAQALAAFETVWAKGVDLNLVVVGHGGWNVDGFIEALRSHPQLGKRLFWLEGISDEYLEKVYAASDCLIAASLGEGFGLPLIEAARHQLSILARDISVFREVGGSFASYFAGEEAEDLAWAIENWLALSSEGRQTSSDGMPWLTWAESAARLKEILLGHAPNSSRAPHEIRRIQGARAPSISDSLIGKWHSSL